MRIATFNVNGINSRLPVLLRWLEQARPDAVCLQELKAPHEKFPHEAIGAVGYESIWHGQKSWNGVAILARGTLPIEVGRGLPGDPDDEQSRYIEAVVDGVLIAGLYLPNGNPAPGPKFDYKLRWLERLITHAAALIDSGSAAVLAGDFNVIPTDLDVYKPERWVDDALFRPEVREAFQRLLAQGWCDALRTLHPGQRIYTFWDYLRNSYARDAGLRIDHLLLSPALTPALKAAGVDRDLRGGERPSDHAPVWVELALTPP
jgi:exodeoxyribonuclease-3